MDLKFDNFKFITDLQIAIGILNIEGLDYTFPHRSLQEYFAASYIQNLSPENKKTIYSKLKLKIDKKYSTLVENLHFYFLLGEMDNYYLVTELAIPLLQNIVIELKKVQKMSNHQAFIFNQKIYYIFRSLLTTNDCLSQIMDTTFDSNQNRRLLNIDMQKLKEREFNSLFQDLKENGRINMDLIISFVNEFPLNIGLIILEIRNCLEQLNRCDEEIIDLI